STHRNAAERGTASWSEFEAAFKTEHTLHEQAFTPSVCGFGKVAWWEDAVKDVSLDIPNRQWKGVSLELLEIVHALPKPLQRRSFAVLQGIAERVDVGAEGGEFVVVTVPVDVKWDLWARAVPARYAAVERFRRVGADVEWVMATASRAGGVLPGWVQDMSVPGVVAKDVDLYLKLDVGNPPTSNGTDWSHEPRAIMERRSDIGRLKDNVESLAPGNVEEENIMKGKVAAKAL
ncbi:hypothetical protein V490_05197, partial [Pseudogymnoascus sp. VKM F-3557]